MTEITYCRFSLKLFILNPSLNIAVVYNGLWAVPLSIQGSLQEQEDSEPDSSLSQSPNVQDWLSHARSTRTQKHHDNLLRQRVRNAFSNDQRGCGCTFDALNVRMVTFQELQHQVAEQRKLLQSVANVGEELLNNQTTLNGDRYFVFSVLF